MLTSKRFHAHACNEKYTDDQARSVGYIEPPGPYFSDPPSMSAPVKKAGCLGLAGLFVLAAMAGAALVQ